jgi:hypothetical protein
METTNDEEFTAKKLYNKNIIYNVDNILIKFLCFNNKKNNFVNISCEVDYIEYEKELTEEEIKQLSPVFNMDVTFFFSMIEKSPTSVKKTDDKIIISYTFDILSRKYNISIVLFEKIIEGKDREIVILERKIRVLEDRCTQNEKKLNQLISLHYSHENLLEKDLTYSTIQSSTLERKNIGKCSYTQFLVYLYEHIGNKLKYDDIGLNIKEGVYLENGFYKSENLKFSFQRKETKGMLTEIIKISKKYNVKINLLIKLKNGELHYV